jgi:hypothetical protein
MPWTRFGQLFGQEFKELTPSYIYILFQKERERGVMPTVLK